MPGRAWLTPRPALPRPADTAPRAKAPGAVVVQANGPPQAPVARSSARSRSAIRSSGSSIPIDRRTRSGSAPAAIC